MGLTSDDGEMGGDVVVVGTCDADVGGAILEEGGEGVRSSGLRDLLRWRRSSSNEERLRYEGDESDEGENGRWTA
jgi:hypothetical protein